MIIYTTDTEYFSETLLEELIRYIHPDRAAYALRASNPEVRIQRIIGSLLLMIALRKEYQMENCPVIESSPLGKPVLRDYPYIHFNLSHSDGVVACMTSDVPCGIDVQHCIPYRESVANRYFSEAEQCKLHDLKDPHESSMYFTALWTRFECQTKLIGTGISGSISAILDDPTEITTLYFSDFCMSISGVLNHPPVPMKGPEIIGFFRRNYPKKVSF